MWIFTSTAFLSIVDKGGDGSTLLVRGRRKGEIESVFPDAQVQITKHNDYRYRARIDREQVALAMAEMIRDLRYGNHKSSIRNHELHDACMKVWEVMYHYQATE